MRKPLIALSLAASTGFGAIPVASALAASPSRNTPPTPPSSQTPSTTPGAFTPSRTSNTVSGASIVSYALKYLGYPYTATGNSPATGFSCIGFVSYVYRSLGIPLPGDLGNAYAFAPQVPFSNLLPGDILYFQNTVWPGISHAAIYLGGGKFVHAEWYGKGVRISSFQNDPSDGDYWIGKYLGANRPWSGAAVGSVVLPSNPTPSQPSTGTSTNPQVSVQKTLQTGPTAIVTVSSLNVRQSPSKRAYVQTVVAQGTTVTVIGHKGSWAEVQLQDGTTGWVMSRFIGGGTTAAASSSTAASSTANAQVNNPTAPTVLKKVTAPAKHGPTVKAKVTGLRVHSSPSLGAPVVTSVAKGQHMTVIGRSGDWIKVQLPNGQVGWVSAAYAKGAAKAPAAAGPAAKVAAPVVKTSGTHVKTAVNVRANPSLKATVITVIPPGGSYRVIASVSGWYKVQLSNGTVGWVSASVLGAVPSNPSNTYTPTTTRKAATTAGKNVLTAGVRVHSAPGVKAPVVTVAAAGTHVTVLGSSNGWTLVRLPNGKTGYVLGTYVR